MHTGVNSSKNPFYFLISFSFVVGLFPLQITELVSGMKIGKLFASVGLYVEGPSTTSIANVRHVSIDKPPFFA